MGSSQLAFAALLAELIAFYGLGSIDAPDLALSAYLAAQINQTALYAEAAGALKLAVPSSPLRSSTLIDGVVWDGSNPAAYADSFAIKA